MTSEYANLGTFVQVYPVKMDLLDMILMYMLSFPTRMQSTLQYGWLVWLIINKKNKKSEAEQHKAVGSRETQTVERLCSFLAGISAPRTAPRERPNYPALNHIMSILWPVGIAL